MSPLEELCLGAVLVLAGAVWWLFGMRVLDRALGRGTGQAFGEPSTVAIVPAVARWGLALLAFAVGGWRIGDAIAKDSAHSTKGTLGYLAMAIGGGLLASTSLLLWRVYPWWKIHNPIARVLRVGYSNVRSVFVAPEHSASDQDYEQPGSEALDTTETRELSKREARSMTFMEIMERLRFAQFPFVAGAMITGIALYRLLHS